MEFYPFRNLTVNMNLDPCLPRNSQANQTLSYYLNYFCIWLAFGPVLMSIRTSPFTSLFLLSKLQPILLQFTLTPLGLPVLPPTVLLKPTPPPLLFSHHALSQLNCQSQSPWWLIASSAEEKTKDQKPTGLCIQTEKKETKWAGEWEKKSSAHFVSDNKQKSCVLWSHHLPTFNLLWMPPFSPGLTAEFMSTFTQTLKNVNSQANTMREGEIESQKRRWKQREIIARSGGPFTPGFV